MHKCNSVVLILELRNEFILGSIHGVHVDSFSTLSLTVNSLLCIVFIINVFYPCPF